MHGRVGVLVQPRCAVVTRLQRDLDVLVGVGPWPAKVLDQDVELPRVSARVDVRVEAVRPDFAVTDFGTRAEGLLRTLIGNDSGDLARKVAGKRSEERRVGKECRGRCA